MQTKAGRPARPRICRHLPILISISLMAATFSHQVDRRLPRRSLLKQEARLSYFDDSSPLATPGFRSGAQSPTGITEALGDALAAGGSTPAIIDEDLAQGESRVKSTRNVETQPPSDSRQNISRQNTNIANGLASYYAIWVGGISAFTLENDLARVFEPFARKKTTVICSRSTAT
mmetsp:Transcript_14283/g.34814  ORF Transcript_14283/g.34814 Transcript_14283/m.34814 type:complete len:175 (-) Transcript_14283:895-1419(-)